MQLTELKKRAVTKKRVPIHIDIPVKPKCHRVKRATTEVLTNKWDALFTLFY